MRKTTFALALLFVAAFAPMTLRGETTNACEQAPLVEPPAAVKFIHPGVRHGYAKPEGLLCEPKVGLECSLGFLMRDPQDANRVYALGAGHCFGDVDAGAGQFRYAYHHEHGAWGRVLYSVGNAVTGQVTHDIALIRVFDWAQDNVDPAVPVFGGPQGMVQPGDAAPEDGKLAHYGMPLVPGSPVGLPRVGILLGWNGVYFECTCATRGGDSGSPYLDLDGGGRAVGMHFGRMTDTLTGVPAVDGATTVHSVGPLLHTQLDLLEAKNPAWGRLTLYEAPLSAFGAGLAQSADGP